MFTFDELKGFVNMITRNHRKNGTLEQILAKALAAFEEQTGLKTARIRWRTLPAAWNAPDTVITWKQHLPATNILVTAEVTTARLGPVLGRYRAMAAPALLITRYVNPALGGLLRDEGVQFIDAAGNGFFEQAAPFFRVWVEGRKPPAELQPIRPVKIFRGTGLRMIFPLLCLPEAVALPYRTIAKYAGVALGAVAQMMEELKKAEYLRDKKTGRVLENRAKLLDGWVDAFPRELRPLLKPRRYRMDDANWWKHTDPATYGMVLGGEVAAASLIGHLRPQIVTVYGTDAFRNFAQHFRPIKDETGTLMLMERFWRFETTEALGRKHLAPLPLVYAELVATADARNLETAAILRGKYLD
jgi:hypothetical protein